MSTRRSPKKDNICLGSHHGGVDVIPLTDVGICNHFIFHNLKLQDGHSYFATVIGTLLCVISDIAKGEGWSTANRLRAKSLNAVFCHCPSLLFYLFYCFGCH